MPITLGVLGSGRGSNFDAILQNIDKKSLDARIAVVISDKKDAPLLKKAADHGIKSVFIVPQASQIREDYDRQILSVLQKEKVELVCLAGYMKIVTKVLVQGFPNKILNIHPALLPSFKGLHAQRQALESGVKVSGCTVHVVNVELDAGPIIIQRAVEVKDNDSEETLSDRILEQEHKIYSEAISYFSENRIKISGKKVIIGIKGA